MSAIAGIELSGRKSGLFAGPDRGVFVVKQQFIHNFISVIGIILNKNT
jgi:hypothetical protein